MSNDLSVTLLPNGSLHFTIVVPQGGYVMNAEGAEDFDPVIHRYRLEGAELHLVASNDDAGNEWPHLLVRSASLTG